MKLSPEDLCRILHRRIFQAGTILAALLLGVACTAISTAAQEDRPQITPGERKPTRKKDAGPRAVGILQLSANGKASLVPIAIMINGRFWDATAYKADPVPMALESGTVYEAERAGNSLGLFTVGSALHANSPAAPVPWMATGSWRPVGMEPVKKELKAEAAPLGLDSGDGPPRLTRDPTPASDKPAASTPSAPSKSSGSTDSDDRPRLTKGSSSPDSAPPSAPPSAGADSPSDKKPAESKSPDSKSSEAKSDERAKIPASDSGAADANRPRLRRGKPAESFADEDVPGYSKPGETPSSTKPAKLVETTAANTNVKLIPAISDAAGPDPRPFTFQWIPGEEADRQKEMMDLAKAQLRAYVDARSKANATAKPVHVAASKRAPAPKPVEPIFENVQMVAYDLWNSNQPVLILSAEAHMPPPIAGSAHPDVNSDLQYSILLVAYPDIYHNLHKLHSAITDKYHLDVTPKLELIDALDADGDDRGELLFRETSDQGTGWAIYRATPDKLWKLFDSLNP